MTETGLEIRKRAFLDWWNREFGSRDVDEQLRRAFLAGYERGRGDEMERLARHFEKQNASVTSEEQD